MEPAGDRRGRSRQIAMALAGGEKRVPEKLAQTLGLQTGQVSVKFKTAERVGPVGEGRSAEAQALVTICQQR